MTEIKENQVKVKSTVEKVVKQENIKNKVNKNKSQKKKEKKNECKENQLTPYQGNLRTFGYFNCKECKKSWSSAYSWSNTSQQCLTCRKNIYPHMQVNLLKIIKKKYSSIIIFFISIHRENWKRIMRKEINLKIRLMKKSYVKCAEN